MMSLASTLFTTSASLPSLHVPTQRSTRRKGNLGSEKFVKQFCPLESHLETNGPGFQPLCWLVSCVFGYGFQPQFAPTFPHRMATGLARITGSSMLHK